MTDRSAARLAYGLALVALVLDVFGAYLLALTRHVGSTESTASVPNDALSAVTVVPFVVIGTLVAARRSRNPIGWVFLVMGLLAALGLVLERYAIYTLLVNPGWGRGGATAAILQSSAYLVALTTLLLLIVLFPSGRAATQRWKLLTLLGSAALIGAYAVTCMKPGALAEPFEQFENPLGVQALSSGAEIALGILVAIGGLILLAAVVSAVRRFRRSRGVERAQFKWFAAAAALVAAGLIAHSIADAVAPGAIDTIELLVNLAIAALPIAAGIAILRYRLYEIDRMINRTVVYGALTAGLAGLYFGVVIALQQIFGGFARGNDLAIAGSTLAVAALFRPARGRIQALVDRRFYRQRYDAEQTLAAFNTRLRDEVDLDQLGSELRAIVEETVQPAHVSIWLREATVPAVTISGRLPGTKEVR
jgi:hypothetical protein